MTYDVAQYAVAARLWPPVAVHGCGTGRCGRPPAMLYGMAAALLCGTADSLCEGRGAMYDVAPGLHYLLKLNLRYGIFTWYR